MNKSIEIVWEAIRWVEKPGTHKLTKNKKHKSLKNELIDNLPNELIDNLPKWRSQRQKYAQGRKQYLQAHKGKYMLFCSFNDGWRQWWLRATMILVHCSGYWFEPDKDGNDSDCIS